MNYLILIFLTLLASCGSKEGGTSSAGTAAPEVLIYGSPPTTGTGTDPLAQYQWHLNNTGQFTFASSGGTAGKDLNLPAGMTETGSGITVLVSDDSVEHFHDDLYDNWSLSSSLNFLNASYAGSPAPGLRSDDTHGTSVAGIIGAIKNNGTGGYGIAPEVTLAGANTLSQAVSQVNSIFIAQANTNAHIVNMSWGTSQDVYSPIISGYKDQIESATSTLRSGRGTIFIKSAGNDYEIYKDGKYRVGNSNLDGDNTLPQIISVAALDADFFSAYYSSPGSNIWISAPGGINGTSEPAILTTDRLGCNYGYAKSTVSNTFNRDANAVNNDDCKYTSLFNGTSSAAPMVSGAVALLLEKNPNLTWRQVKAILAQSAASITSPSSNINTPDVSSSETMPSGLAWEYAWQTNNAGYRFQNWYGFGAVDITAMLNLASTPPALGTLKTYSETKSIAQSIPDNSSTGTSYTFTANQTFTLEEIEFEFTMSHPNLEEIMIEVISPHGGTPMKSILLNAYSGLRGETSMSNQRFITNAFYGESSTGTWTVKIYDAKAGNGSGTVSSVKINMRGH